ncbi:MAG: hypothetical protein KBS83_09395, partial [Lachnospiraceae bacterium]|nr:hypothetical protein [Candidatus Equihabitans merdae]
MKKGIRKRLLALLTACLMLITALPAVVLAGETNQELGGSITPGIINNLLRGSTISEQLIAETYERDKYGYAVDFIQYELFEAVIDLDGQEIPGITANIRIDDFKVYLDVTASEDAPDYVDIPIIANVYNTETPIQITETITICVVDEYVTTQRASRGGPHTFATGEVLETERLANEITVYRHYVKEGQVVKEECRDCYFYLDTEMGGMMAAYNKSLWEIKPGDEGKDLPALVRTDTPYPGEIHITISGFASGIPFVELYQYLQEGYDSRPYDYYYQGTFAEDYTCLDTDTVVIDKNQEYVVEFVDYYRVRHEFTYR